VARLSAGRALGDRARTELGGRRYTALARALYPTNRDYRAPVDDSSVIGPVRDDAECYLLAGGADVGNDTADPFADASGADLFAVSHGYLQSLGVRTPELYLLDTSRVEFPADIAVVEDIGGGTLQEHWQRQPDDVGRLTAKLGEMLQAMHARVKCGRSWRGAATSIPIRASHRSPRRVIDLYSLTF